MLPVFGSSCADLTFRCTMIRSNQVHNCQQVKSGGLFICRMGCTNPFYKKFSKNVSKIQKILGLTENFLKNLLKKDYKVILSKKQF